MSYITTFPNDSREYRKLDAIANRLTELSATGSKYYVSDTYFDYGQNWMWTTVLCARPNGDTYQAFSPRLQETAIDGDTEDAVNAYFNGKYCMDRNREELIARRRKADTEAILAVYKAN